MGSFSELFSVKEVLNSKGFEVISEGDCSDLLIPLKYLQRSDQDILFDAFNDQRSRSELLHKINDPKFIVTNPAALSLINHNKFISDRNKYSTSFEWYAGELMGRKFSSFSSSYSVEVKDVFRNNITETTGDYDAIVILRDLNFIYFECKTGTFNADKILKAFERAIALHCEFSVILVQSAINLNSLRACIKGITHRFISELELYQIGIKGNPASNVIGWNTCFFASAEGNIEEQLRTIMRINAAKKLSHSYSWGMSDEDYEKLGYIRNLISS